MYSAGTVGAGVERLFDEWLDLGNILWVGFTKKPPVAFSGNRAAQPYITIKAPGGHNSSTRPKYVSYVKPLGEEVSEPISGATRPRFGLRNLLASMVLLARNTKKSLTKYNHGKKGFHRKRIANEIIFFVFAIRVGKKSLVRPWAWLYNCMEFHMYLCISAPICL